MEVNISRTARAAACGSVAPSGAAPRAERGSALLSVFFERFRSRTCITGSGLREIPQFFNCLDDGAVWNVGHDLSGSNRARQHKVHNAVAGLLVRLKAAEDALSAQVHARQWSQRDHCRNDPPSGIRIGLLQRSSDHCSRYHAPRYCFPVEKLLVAGLGFEGMADGMSKVKNAAQVGFLFISRDHGGLKLYRFGY